MTVDELIDRLKELPGYRPVVIPDEFSRVREVVSVADHGALVELVVEP
jgi:hypothetical protein